MFEWTTTQRHPIANANIIFRDIGDGVKFFVVIDGKDVMESSRTYLDVSDAYINAKHWLRELGITIFPQPTTEEMCSDGS